MVLITTLPFIEAGETINEGQQFIVEGKGFNAWPNEIVLSRGENYALNNELPSAALMRLVSKTNTQLVFEQTTTYTYVSAHLWNTFASPFDLPRTLLSYVSE